MLDLLLIICHVIITGEAAPGKPVVGIKGGDIIDIKDVPYQAMYHTIEEYFCEAVIVSKDYVITSADCASWFGAQAFVSAGATDIDNGVHKKIKRVVIHPNYQSVEYNVALVQVDPSFQFGDTIQAVRVANVEPQLGDAGYVAGWGNKPRERPDYGPGNLEGVNLTVSGREKCEQIWRTRGYNITGRMFCVSTPGKGPCWNDWGTGFVSGDVVYGIVSFMGNCDSGSVPAVFVNLASPEIRRFVNETANV